LFEPIRPHLHSNFVKSGYMKKFFSYSKMQYGSLKIPGFDADFNSVKKVAKSSNKKSFQQKK
jgi:hypothetical protein